MLKLKLAMANRCTRNVFRYISVTSNQATLSAHWLKSKCFVLGVELTLGSLSFVESKDLCTINW